MFSNTANNSASDSVKTRPRLNAYLNFITSWIKNNQQKLALILGYLLVAGLFYNLGVFIAQSSPPAVLVSEPEIDLTQIYNNLKLDPTQFAAEEEGAVAGETEILDCEGKIKGNISSSGKIYHLPGGSFYKRTNPELCFDTEAEAQAAGFRKSKR